MCIPLAALCFPASVPAPRGMGQHGREAPAQPSSAFPPCRGWDNSSLAHRHHPGRGRTHYLVRLCSWLSPCLYGRLRPQGGPCSQGLLRLEVAELGLSERSGLPEAWEAQNGS